MTADRMNDNQINYTAALVHRFTKTTNPGLFESGIAAELRKLEADPLEALIAALVIAYQWRTPNPKYKTMKMLGVVVSQLREGVINFGGLQGWELRALESERAGKEFLAAYYANQAHDKEQPESGQGETSIWGQQVSYSGMCRVPGHETYLVSSCRGCRSEILAGMRKAEDYGNPEIYGGHGI